MTRRTTVERPPTPEADARSIARVLPVSSSGCITNVRGPWQRVWRAIMDEDRFNMAVRKFLKEVGLTSQREIERVVREGNLQGRVVRLRMSLTSDDAPSLQHSVETTIDLR